MTTMVLNWVQMYIDGVLRFDIVSLFLVVCTVIAIFSFIALLIKDTKRWIMISVSLMIIALIGKNIFRQIDLSTLSETHLAALSLSYFLFSVLPIFVYPASYIESMVHGKDKV